MRATIAFLLIASMPVLATARAVGTLEETASNAANPIRKVVTMLQSMQAKVTAEGEKEEELYDKFMCYCKTGSGDLQQSISESEAKVPEVDSSIKEAVAKKAQLEADLKDHQASRSEAKEAMAKATAIRDKEAKAFAEESGEYKSNIAALTGAVKALSSGMAGSFLQSGVANTLRKLAMTQDMEDADRQDLIAFLSGKQWQGYVPQSGQILGILQQMKAEMEKSLEEITAEEDSAKADFEALIAAKTKEVDSLTEAIETKSKRVGELAVEIVMMKEDLEDTEAALMNDKKFLADLKGDCDKKTAEWEERSKTRADELLALAETIKILNSDDALDLFKKTLPSASFLQLEVRGAALKAKALAILAEERNKHKPQGVEFDFVELALKGKKIGFEKVIKMIDDMVALLKEEQGEDDQKKDYCATQFDESDDKKKELTNTVADEETAIADAEETIANLKSEIKALGKSIKALDKDVAELTETRKEEHEDYTELIANDSAAKELLAWAKNRLNKFYNPKLYKAPPKRELSEEEKISVSFGGDAMLAQVSDHGSREAPPPPPETYGAYAKKSEESSGVIAMIDLLVKDLDKEMTEAEVEEKDAQKDYEKAMAESSERRAADAKELSSKTSMLAETETSLQMHKDGKASAAKELMTTLDYIKSLHSECDWLMKYYDVRKQARAGEVEALGKAKSVLMGADFSLMQIPQGSRSQNFLGL